MRKRSLMELATLRIFAYNVEGEQYPFTVFGKMDTGVAIFDYMDMVKKAVDKYDENATKSFSDGINGQKDRNMAISNWINKALFGNPARTSSTSNAENQAPVTQSPVVTQPPATPVVRVFKEMVDFDGENMSEPKKYDETEKDVIEKYKNMLGNERKGFSVYSSYNWVFINIVERMSNGDIHVFTFTINNKNDDGSDKFDADHIKEFKEKIKEVIDLNNNESVTIDGYGDDILKVTKTTKDGFLSLEFAVEKKPSVSIGSAEVNTGNGGIMFLESDIEATKKEIDGTDGFKNPYGNKARSKRKFIEDVLNFIRGIRKLDQNEINTTIEIPSEIREYIKNIDDETASSILDNINKNGIKKFVNELFNSKDLINCIITASKYTRL